MIARGMLARAMLLSLVGLSVFTAGCFGGTARRTRCDAHRCRRGLCCSSR